MDCMALKITPSDEAEIITHQSAYFRGGDNYSARFPHFFEFMSHLCVFEGNFGADTIGVLRNNPSIFGEDTLLDELHMLQFARMQSRVSRELGSSLEGEKIIFVMLYTHVMCLPVMYIISHVCMPNLD